MAHRVNSRRRSNSVLSERSGQRAYQRLVEHLNRARRARIILMDVIRDDGGVISEPNHWDSAEQFMAISVEAVLAQQDFS